MNTTWHVAKTGEDTQSGSSEAPFLTISRAAAAAQPGDTVAVHAGTYREWISPRFGGQSDLMRITYKAAEGQKVVIKGSEELSGWEKVEGTVWRASIDNCLFDGDNPYTDLLWGDWFNDQGRDHHRGEVFLNGRALFEKTSLDEIRDPQEWEPALDREASRYVWYCEQVDGHTVFFCNFHEFNPNEELVEISVRPVCFYPRSTGINFITVKGFEICQAAVPWAPPTAEQFGMIGPHWAKGWIIEDNIIHDAKCSGISLGKEQASGENEWGHLKTKHGSQREREVIFRALRLGWSRETVGSHIIRNNTIYDCGQTGICGHLGAVFSTITANHIYNIHAKDQFSGHEMAGIKIHASIDMLIKGNHVHHCTQGLWMDWQAQGLRMTGNLLYENRWNDIHIEVSHGPYTIDNNIFLSPVAIKNVSQGGTYAHNLIGGKVELINVPNRFTPYHFPHSTAVLGVMTILGGDDRFYNNMFLPLDADAEPQRPNFMVPDENRQPQQKHPTVQRFRAVSNGLAAYNEYPLSTAEWRLNRTVDSYAVVKLPVRIGCNYYAAPAEPYHREEDGLSASGRVDLRLDRGDDRVVLHFNVEDSALQMNCPRITTNFLGTSFQAETSYENHDGRPLDVDRDFTGTPRKERPTVGPFENLGTGEQSFVVWERK